jgi:hypothetical protein
VEVDVPLSCAASDATGETGALERAQKKAQPMREREKKTKNGLTGDTGIG